ncbi:hypothetical protein Emed_004208 [Eimeria media]
MCDNIDAFLEDILSLPRCVHRSLCLLRELDLKSQECGEEAQRRRSRYLALAKTKLSAANASNLSVDLYDDPELVAEAEAARDRGREAHALMKEKLVVLNQLIRVLRGETENFKISLAKFAREVGGEDTLRHCNKRKPEGNVVGYTERPEEEGAHSSASPTAWGPLSPLSSRPTATRNNRIAGGSALSSSAVGGPPALGFVVDSETPSEALSSLPPGLAPSVSVAASRNKQSKKAAVRSSGSTTTTSLAADGARSAKRPKPPTAAVGAAAKNYQGGGGALHAEADEGLLMQVHTGAAKGMGAPLLAEGGGGPLCSGSSSLGSHQSLPSSRLKRAKQATDALQEAHAFGAESAQVLPCAAAEDKLNCGRAGRVTNGRPKKSKEAVASSFSFGNNGNNGETAKTAADARHCAPPESVKDGFEEGGGQLSGGLVIRLPPTLPLNQQHASSVKAKSPSERTNSKHQPLKPLAPRLNTSRVIPG